MSSAFIVLMICLILLCVILIFLVLSQNPKGGGLSGTFGGGGTQMFGVQNTNKFMDKATWTITGTIAGIVILSGVLIAKPLPAVDDAPQNKPKTEASKTEQKPVSNPDSEK